MSTQFNNNTTELQELLNMANSLPESLDTSDATATATDMAKDKTAYVNGEKVVGTLREYVEDPNMIPTLNNPSIQYEQSAAPEFWFQGNIGPAGIYRTGAIVGTHIEASTFGNVSVNDVAKEKTFTSENGLKLAGTLIDIASGSDIYTDNVIATSSTVSGKVYDICLTGENSVDRIIRSGSFVKNSISGSEFGDAASEDVIAGKTFTSSAGLKVTGELPEKKTGETINLQNGTLDVATVSGEELNIRAKGEVQSDTLIRSGGFTRISFKASEFGDAAPEDVLSGKTFTSAAGLLKTGTATLSNASSILSTTATPTANSLSISFTGLKGEPSMFSVYPTETMTVSSTTGRVVAGVEYDGETICGITTYRSTSSAQNTYSATAFSYTYSDGTLTVKSASTTNGGDFMSGITYKLSYVTEASSDSGSAGSGSPDGETGTGVVIKTGTTTSATINTGLSDVEQFFIYKESQTATGLIHLHYTKSATSRMYASAWSTSAYGTKTITNGTGGVTVNGGTVTISATQAAQGALTSGITYNWVAIGAE